MDRVLSNSTTAARVPAASNAKLLTREPSCSGSTTRVLSAGTFSAAAEPPGLLGPGLLGPGLLGPPLSAPLVAGSSAGAGAGASSAHTRRLPEAASSTAPPAHEASQRAAVAPASQLPSSRPLRQSHSRISPSSPLLATSGPLPRVCGGPGGGPRGQPNGCTGRARERAAQQRGGSRSRSS